MQVHSRIVADPVVVGVFYSHGHSMEFRSFAKTRRLWQALGRRSWQGQGSLKAALISLAADSSPLLQHSSAVSRKHWLPLAGACSHVMQVVSESSGQWHCAWHCCLSESSWQAVCRLRGRLCSQGTGNADVNMLDCVGLVCPIHLFPQTKSEMALLPRLVLLLIIVAFFPRTSELCENGAVGSQRICFNMMSLQLCLQLARTDSSVC